ncbi:MAG: hypothetical protein M0D57_15480 [Sphingobacteriales bacterium JAD_PAG50586_3]|nr:MAG: hypothetical protein M0D57_15480 [Sphingobacteriales bacterium JAD_PAG50586_3]
MDLVERNNTLANQLLEKEIMLEEQDARIKLLLLVEADLKSAQAENAELVAKLKESQSTESGTPALAEENALLTKQLADKDARITELLEAEADLKAARAENAELAGKLKDSQAPVADTAGNNEENAALLKQLEEKEALLAEKENQLKESGLLLKELGETNNLHNLAQSISGNTGSEQNEDLKLIITDLVKEIDKCITLLGKNV